MHEAPPRSTGIISPHSSPEVASESPGLTRALAGLDNGSWPEEEMPEAFDINEALEPATQSLSSSSSPRLVPLPRHPALNSVIRPNASSGSACRDWTGKQTTVTTIRPIARPISRATSSNWTTARDGSSPGRPRPHPGWKRETELSVVPTDEEVSSHALRAIAESW